MKKKKHRVLVVDDDPAVVATVVAALTLQGHEARVATNVKDALLAIEEEDFCLLVVDQQLPLDGSGHAMAFAGETIMRAARAKDRRHTDDGLWFSLQIVALTSYSGKSGYVTRVHQAGAHVFMEKPLESDESVRQFLDIVRTCLERAGRADHARCEGLVRVKAASVGEDVNKALEERVPESFSVIEGDRQRRFRLNPKVGVERVDWERLLSHPDDGVKRLAKEMTKRT